MGNTHAEERKHSRKKTPTLLLELPLVVQVGLPAPSPGRTRRSGGLPFRPCGSVTISGKSSTPAENAGACEAIRLAIGEPTRVTARLAYPSSGNRASEGS